MATGPVQERLEGDTVDVCLPQDQQDGTRAVLGARLKQCGDPVLAHEPIAEIETDKVVVELSAPHDGVLSEWCHEVGDELSPGATVARMSASGAVAQVSAAVSSSPPEPCDGDGAPDASHRLSPAVKRLLAEHHLDLERVLSVVGGSGRDGRLSAADIRRYLAEHHRPEAPPGALEAADVMLANRAGVGTARRLPLSPMRRAIGEHMSRSLLQTAPHVTTVFECDMGRVLVHRKAHRERLRERGVDLSLTAYFVFAAAAALREVPEVNSSLDGEELLLWDDINIGLAVALGSDGLVVPVLRRVHQMNLFGIAQGMGELTDRARARSLSAQDMQGGTFTISNHGVSGSLLAAPVIINQPQSAILGIGKLRKEVVVREIDGEDLIRIARMCYLTLSLDHRVLDAYAANEFMARMVAVLEGWNADQE